MPVQSDLSKFIWKVLFSLILLVVILGLMLSMEPVRWVEGRKKEYISRQQHAPIDLLVMGSSRAEHCFNTALVDKKKFNVFNLGEDGHGLPSNYLMLKVMLDKYHLNIKKVLLQIDEASFNGSRGFSRKFRDDYFLTDLKDPEVYKAFQQYRGNGWAWSLKHYPPLGNLLYDDFYKFVKHFAFVFKGWVPSIENRYEANVNLFSKTKGYSPYDPEIVKIEDHNFDFESDDKDYFEKLVSRCASEKIELILFRGPFLACNKIKSPKYEAYISEFLKSHPEIKYLDYKCSYQIPSQYMDQFHPADSISTLLSYDLMNALKLH
jgi:hypothetical protein